MMIICGTLTGRNLLVSVHNDFMPLFSVVVYIRDFSVDILTKKFDRAKKGWAEAELAYLGLANSHNPLTVDGWKEEQCHAMEERGDRLMIFELKMKKGSLSQILAPVYFLMLSRTNACTNLPGSCRNAEKPPN